MFRIISSMVIPLALLGLAILLYPKLGGLPDSQLVVIKFAPLAIAIISMSLCLRFNRSLVFFATLALVSVYGLMQWYLPRLGWVEAKTVWTALCLLLPFNIMVVSLLKERGMLTLWGVSRFAILLLPALIIIVVVKYYPDPVLRLLTWRFVDQPMLNQLDFAQLPLVMMVIAVLALNGRWFLRTTAQNSALLIMLVAAIEMLYFRDEPLVSAVFACAGMLMLVIAVIQESWSMAYIDQLTNLPGRRALDEEMLKLGSNYAIAMLDIDHFKKFNDTYGHDTGDQVLQMVAARIRQSVSGGRAFRYGGEEFTIVFPGRCAEDTLAILNGVRENVGSSKFQVRKKERRGKGNKGNGKNVQVTISIGVAERTEKMPTPREVIKGADKALYKAKKQGRNRVCK
ncbi:MAG: GGDEF domain-containing protein [Gammaproteobacteria bacterium]|nr:GGDEF domain-containing protein [Gammaproteobacteria bacterium]